MCLEDPADGEVTVNALMGALHGAGIVGILLQEGGKAVGLSTTAMSLKLDNDLYLALNSHGLNKNRYINDAVREAMKRDMLIFD